MAKWVLFAEVLRLQSPEDLDYTDVFNDVFEKYTSSCEMIKVKSVNMGSMFRITYELTLRDAKKEKEFIELTKRRLENE